MAGLNLMACRSDDDDGGPDRNRDTLTLESAIIDTHNLQLGGQTKGIDLVPTFKLTFSQNVDLQDLQKELSISGPGGSHQVTIQTPDGRQFTVLPTNPLRHLSKYRLSISSSLASSEGHPYAGTFYDFYTRLDTTTQFPPLSDDALLDLIQSRTFEYFWSFGHPQSGMARERNSSGDLVTTGGSGFGLMSMVVAAERGWINRAEAIARWTKMLTFLENADRFKGVFPHWLNGVSGKTIPFSAKDNGGDLVETSLLFMGWLTVRQYLQESISTEKQLIDRINDLWEAVQWNWHTKRGETVLYWHWSPDFGWEQNLPIQGYNEALITYVLAAASPTYGIEPAVYDAGWTRNGRFVNGNSYYGIELALGPDYGGPLFFSQYSFLGLDPRKLSDPYTSYFTLGQNHSRINQAHCIQNPNNFIGYSAACWGLTASDNHQGYSAHSPSNDLGVLTPTAALSAMPYTPEASMMAARHFYYHLGDRLWGNYGFYDAFNPTEGWVADSYLAIDQGPIVCMIENHRSGLLWDLFMSAPEIQSALTKLGFDY